MNIDLIAKHYDTLFGHFDDDLPMWEEIAQAAIPEGERPTILEIGCGTGRLLVPFAQAGYSITGLDLSEVALETAKSKLDTEGISPTRGQRIRLEQADMRSFDLDDKPFDFAFIPLNTFMHCETIEDQLATLKNVHRHLQAGGLLAIDLFYPDPTLLAEADGTLYFEDEIVNESTGYTTQWYWRHDIDLENQMRHMVYLLDEIDPAGHVRRVSIPFSLRYFYRYEVELLLKMSGFTVETIFGEYDLSPFEGHSQKMIFVARKQS